MPAPLGKHVRFPGGTRPWNIPQKEKKELAWDDYKTKRALSSCDSQEAIEACLACKYPDCDPYAGCKVYPIKNKSGPSNRLDPPEDFLKWGWGPMTNREWAEQLQVSTSTIARWRREYGLKRK